MVATYELRIYTLDSEASADAYEEIWRRHIDSLAEFGIHVQGMWRPLAQRDRLVVLTGTPDGADIEELGRSYMRSPGFLADFDHVEGGFEAFKHRILGVESTVMKPIAASPMQ